jgi:thioesterase domain-containing protein
MSSGDVLVRVQVGGQERPFFFVAAAHRDIFGAAHLARALGKEWPLYTLQPPTPAGRHDVVIPRLDDLVACYAENLRRAQPRGPYRLGGYSTGGLIAIEVARTLARAGERVELVALLDSSARVGSRASFRFLSILRRLASRWSLSPRAGEPRHLRLFRSALTDAGMFATTTALQGHRPAPFDACPVVLLQSRGEGLTALRVPTHGWEQVVRSGLSVESVPGDHDSCMQPPHVAVLAEKLRTHLASSSPQAASTGALP